MKKLVVAVAFVLAAQAGMAQTQDDAFKKDVLKVLEMSGANAVLQSAKDQILKMVPAEKQAAFLVEFNATLPAFNEKIAKIYMETYTPEDVKSMIKFYETPVGKKIYANAGIMFEKSQAAGQEWGEGLQAVVMKYMQ